MQVIGDKPLVCFDVDDTLVFSDSLGGAWIGQTVIIGGRNWRVHWKHVQLLLDFKARGHTVVVWSQGGSKWAREVVQALNLEDSVDLIMPKPFWYVDDKLVSQWMEETRHTYLELEEK